MAFVVWLRLSPWLPQYKHNLSQRHFSSLWQYYELLWTLFPLVYEEKCRKNMRGRRDGDAMLYLPNPFCIWLQSWGFDWSNALNQTSSTERGAGKASISWSFYKIYIAKSVGRPEDIFSLLPISGAGLAFQWRKYFYSYVHLLAAITCFSRKIKLNAKIRSWNESMGLEDFGS